MSNVDNLAQLIVILCKINLKSTDRGQSSDVAPPPAVSNDQILVLCLLWAVLLIMYVSVVAGQHINDLYLQEVRHQTKAARIIVG